MTKTNMRIRQGVWIVSTVLYGVEIIATAGDVRVALKALKDDIEWLKINLYLFIERSAEI